MSGGDNRVGTKQNLAPFLSMTGFHSTRVKSRLDPISLRLIHHKKKDSIFKIIGRVLQENQLKSGGKDTEHKLRTINRLQEDGKQLYVLKKILNIIFLTTGMALLLGVIVVIVYTAVCK